MGEISAEHWLATHRSEGPTHVHELDHAVQHAYDDIAEAIKRLAAGFYIPAREPLRDALDWLKIADEADAWIKMTEGRRRTAGPS